MAGDGDKQFRRSLKTNVRKLAERRLTELRGQVGNLTISDDAKLSFTELSKRWMEASRDFGVEINQQATERVQTLDG